MKSSNVVIVAMGIAGLASAMPPWWLDRGVLDTNAPPNDFAVANQGQAKWFALQARDLFESTLPGGAGAVVEALVSGFSVTNNFLPLNLGQLKAVADPYYARLAQLGWTNAFPAGTEGLRPWTATTADDNDFAIVNLGQLKYVFSFDPESFLLLDTDGDGMPDWWEIAHGLDPYDPDDAQLISPLHWAGVLTNLQVYENPSVLNGEVFSTLDDGLPDWWKVLHGFDISDPGVAGGDPDGDGWSNLSEFRRSSNPGHNDTLALLVDTTYHGQHKHGFWDNIPTIPPRIWLKKIDKYENGTYTWTMNPITGIGDSQYEGGSPSGYFITSNYTNEHTTQVLWTNAAAGMCEREFTEDFDGLSLGGATISSLILEQTEGQEEMDINAVKCQYMFNLDSATNGVLGWVEMFSPQDDPETFTVVGIHTHELGSFVTGLYTNNPFEINGGPYGTYSIAAVIADLDADTDRDGMVAEWDEHDEDLFSLERGALIPPVDYTTTTNFPAWIPRIAVRTPISDLAHAGLTMRFRLEDENDYSNVNLVNPAGTRIAFGYDPAEVVLDEWPAADAWFYFSARKPRTKSGSGPENLWAGLDLTIEIMTNHHVIVSDTVRLTVAPLILPPECYPAEEVVAGAVTNLQDVTVLNGWTSSNMWLQDMVKFTATQVSTGAVHAVAALLDHDDHANLQDILRDRQLATLLLSEVNGDGGNIMATPPLPGHPYGKILIGDRNTTSVSFWESQGIQPVQVMPTDWLYVGHVDEAVMFIETNKVLFADPWCAADLLHQEIAAGNHTNTMWFGLVPAAYRTHTIAEVVIAHTTSNQPKLAALPAGGLPNNTNTVAVVFDTHPFETNDVLRVNYEILKIESVNGTTVTVARARGGRAAQAHPEGSVVYALSDVMTINLPVLADPYESVVGKMQVVTNTLRTALGGAPMNFMAMPVLFDMVTEGGRSGFVAATPNVVNCLMIDPASKIIMPRPGIACFEGEVLSKVPQAQGYFYDFWELHKLKGNIHCATATIRAISSEPPWWTRITNWE